MACTHEGCAAAIKLPGLHGRPLHDQCPFAWCTECGALWLPKQEKFDRAFENHLKERAHLPVDGVTIEGYWILVGRSALILPGN